MGEDLNQKVSRIDERNKIRDEESVLFRKEIKETIKEICDKVDNIIEKLISRPGWLVLLIISGLMSTCSALIIYIITTK